MIHITKRKAQTLLRRVVKKHGRDHTVNRCVYFHAGQPVCIVGQVLAEAGAKPEWFKSLNDKGIKSLFAEEEPTWLYKDKATKNKKKLNEKVVIDDDALAVLKVAQDVQDNVFLNDRGSWYGFTKDKTWGTALDKALEI